LNPLALTLAITLIAVGATEHLGRVAGDEPAWV
jgi:hypothetical protein